jgi:hypothetical protein
MSTAVATSSAGSPPVSNALHRKAEPEPGGCVLADAMGAATIQTASGDPATIVHTLLGIVGSFRLDRTRSVHRS